MGEKHAVGRKYVAISQAAEFAGLSPGTIRNLIATGELTAFRPVPGRIVLDLYEVDRLVRGSSGQSSTRGHKTVGSAEPCVTIAQEKAEDSGPVGANDPAKCAHL